MKYIIFDLESTCWKSKECKNIREVIEIGAVKVENKKITDSFQTFVKPVIHPILSDFCSNLTTIKQVDVKDAPVFSLAIENFFQWTGNFKELTFLSWGHYDRKQIVNESLKKDCFSQKVFDFNNKHYSLKHDFAQIKRIKPCGMKKALHLLELEMKGTNHRAIDDAANISDIFLSVLQDWEKFRHLT